MRFIIILSSIFFLSSCSSEKASVSASLNNSHIQKFGDSKYSLIIPDSFKTAEGRGKEGQLGYSITPTDSSSTMYAFIQIVRGYGTEKNFPEEESGKYEIINIPGSQTIWKLYKTKTGYFEAITKKELVEASVVSKNRQEINYLISILSTLKKKNSNVF